jgi:hypothetical protein
MVHVDDNNIRERREIKKYTASYDFTLHAPQNDALPPMDAGGY